MPLTFGPNKKPRTLDRVTQRRQKIINGIDQQLIVLDQHRQGKADKSAWFWQELDGRYFLSIRYGRTEVELAKGMYSVECSNIESVGDALMEIRSMILQGKLDDSLQKSSDKLRAKFKAD